MEILGDPRQGSDDDELGRELDRRRNPRRGEEDDGQGGPGGQRRRPVAASLDLGTMQLSPDAPAAYGRPPVPPPPPTPTSTGTSTSTSTSTSPTPATDPVTGPVTGASAPGTGASAGSEWARPAPGTVRAQATPAPSWADLNRLAPGPATAADSSPGAPRGGAVPRDVMDVGGDDAASMHAPEVDPGDAHLLDARPDARPHEVHERDYRPPISAVLTAAPTLALAGLLVCCAGLTGGAPLVVLYAQLTGDPAVVAAELVAKALAAVALISGVLAVAALRRVRVSTPHWVPTVAAATLLVAAVMLAAAGYFWWAAGSETQLTVE